MRDPACRGVVEAGQQVRNRALAGARAANDGRRLTGLKLEAHVVQCRDVLAVFEGHRIERDAAPGGQVPGILRNAERGLRVQYLEYPLARSGGPGEELHHPLHRSNRRRQQHHVQHERRQRARCHRSLLHLPPAEQQCSRYDDGEQERQDGVPGDEELVGDDEVGGGSPRPLSEPLRLVVSRAQHLDRPHPGHRFVGHGVHASGLPQRLPVDHV